MLQLYASEYERKVFIDLFTVGKHIKIATSKVTLTKKVNEESNDNVQVEKY